jgi:hexosaminidase
MRIFFLVLSTFCFVACSDIHVRNIEHDLGFPALIPLPSDLQSVDGAAFLVYAGDGITADARFAAEAELLRSRWQLAESTAGTPHVTLIHDAQITEAEGYRLTVDQNGIHIAASTPTGAFYAVQTLIQLELPAITGEHTAALAHVAIADAPRFPHRGMLLDCCRHFMEVDFVKRYIDLLARYKMNVLHWHLTEDQGWRFESMAYPKLTEVGAYRTLEDGSRYGGFYTQDQMRDVVAYAAARHITVIPEIELPGHSSAAIASYPWLSCTGDSIDVETEWGVFKDIYCAGNDSTLRFLETIFDEVLAIFPSKVIHIGGDEAPKARWETCSKCQHRIQTEQLHDEHELQSWMVGHFANYLAQHGRELIGWDEILEGGLPAGCRVQSWRGVEGGIAAAKSGHYAVMSPTSHAYFDYDVRSTSLEKVYAFEPIPDGLSETEQSFIVGGECNMWTEHAPQDKVDSKMFPRMLAMAEVLWSPAASRDFADFKLRVQCEYPRLDALGVDYGMEAIPVEVHSTAEPGQLTLHVHRTVDGLDLQVAWDNALPQPLVDSLLQVPAAAKVLHVVPIRQSNQQPYGDTLLFPVAVHRALGAELSAAFAYSPYYTGGGDGALIDGLVGSHDFRDGHWQGFSGNDAIITLKLKGGAASISTIQLACYTYSNAWIFMPEEVLVEASSDGATWHPTARSKNPLQPTDKRQGVEWMEVAFAPVECAYVRVTARNRGVCPSWHDAPGEPAWLFLSEIVVQ